jgi:thiamine biosynthesis protein ThiS
MITVNGVEKTLEKPLSVTEYLETNKYVPVQVAIELNDKILARELYGTTILKEGDVMEIVSFMGGGSGKNEDKLVLGGHEFTSRFILGSGKFTQESTDTVADHSDLDWPEATWNFACSTTETSTWAEGGRKFGELMEKATGGKIKVNVYAADQLTNGNQSEGIQALMNGDPVQISMHSNLIYSAFDPRFNVVSLPFIYDSYDDADAKFDGEAGDKLKEILSSYGLHCMGIAENGFRELTNSKHEVKTVDDMKNLKIRVAGSNLLMECYKRWGADATNMNWSETYTALQQNTVEGQENPLPAIDAASVQEVQPYCSMWDAIYDCLFFCINQDLYDQKEYKLIVCDRAKQSRCSICNTKLGTYK